MWLLPARLKVGHGCADHAQSVDRLDVTMFQNDPFDPRSITLRRSSSRSLQIDIPKLLKSKTIIDKIQSELKAIITIFLITD